MVSSVWGHKIAVLRTKKSRRFRRLLKLITGRRQTEWTGATRCPNEDDPSHKGESLILRKRAIFFRDYLPCRPLAEFVVDSNCWSSLRKQGPRTTGDCEYWKSASGLPQDGPRRMGPCVRRDDVVRECVLETL